MVSLKVSCRAILLRGIDITDLSDSYPVCKLQEEDIRSLTGKKVAYILKKVNVPILRKSAPILAPYQVQRGARAVFPF